MKKHLVVFFLLITAICMAWPNSEDISNVPGANFGWNSTTNKWQPFAITGSGTTPVEVGDVTIASETIGLVTAINAVTAGVTSNTAEITKTLPATIIATSTHALSANVAYEAGGDAAAMKNLTGVTRKWIEISSSTDEEFWLNVGATTATGTVGTGRRCVGNVRLEIPCNVAYLTNVIASTAMQLFVIEGGY